MRVVLHLAVFANALITSAAWPQSLRLSPCHVPGIETELRCGTFDVRENRRDRKSRLIPLPVIVVPSRAEHPLPDPVFMVSPGGPGTTNSTALPILAWHSWMRDKRDIVIIDLRGTSGPSRLDCAMVDPAAPSADYLGPLFPKTRITRCRNELATRADLRFYTTPIIVQDFDEVRRALGYAKVNLWGVSWGTRVEYLWLRMHPETVRSAILAGTAPVNLLNPLPHARTAQHALDGLFAECQRQPRCNAAFPNVKTELDSVLARLTREPATVHMRGESPRGTATVRLTRSEFAEGLRVMTYGPPRSLRVPMLVHHAYEGRYDEFAMAAVESNRRLRSSLRFGFLLAVTCTEDVSRIDPRTIERETAHTYLGDTRVREQMAACDGWPRGQLPADYGIPVRSDVPTFLLSGTVDPVAGAELTAQAAKSLKNSIHVIAPGGHVPFGPCIDRMEEAFLDAANPRVVDTACVATMRLPDFAVDSSSGAPPAAGRPTSPSS